MVKIGVLGIGHLGKIHLKCLANTPFQIQGVFDPKFEDDSKCEDFKIYKNAQHLINACDACIIASTTQTHYDLALKVIEGNKHVFIEKPMTSTVLQAQKLVELLSQKPNIVSQIGFVERYNPAYKFISQSIEKPKFIEVHRLATFNERGSDVSVVFDLMIHDLDLVLSMMDSEVKEIKANGIKLISDSLDICNARIEFENKAVVNLTASRISLKSMRKFRVFQNDTYLSLDLNQKKAEIIRLSDEDNEENMKIAFGGKEKYFSYKSSGELKGNAIEDELNDFYKSIVNKEPAKINAQSAYKTTNLAHQIEQIAIQSSIL